MRFFYAILVGAILIGVGFSADARVVNGIDAVVHDSVITFMDVDQASDRLTRQLQDQYRSQPDVLNQKLTALSKDTLEELEQRKLILHEFETAGYNLPESIIDQEFDNYIKSKYPDRVTFTKTLQQEGITYEQERRNYRETFIVEQMRYKNISSAIMISPHKIETYYVAHQDDFKEEDQVKLRMIVLTKVREGDNSQKQKLAEEILGKLNEGASFSDMANIYSQDKQQGDRPWMEKSALRQELADAAFKLKAGEKSGVIDTPEAYYILQVEDKREARVKPLPEVRDPIEKILLAQERTRLQQAWIDKLKKKTFIRSFEY
jgi:parvulin-like peptidyl-prolyl isomerase